MQCLKFLLINPIARLAIEISRREKIQRYLKQNFFYTVLLNLTFSCLLTSIFLIHNRGDVAKVLRQLPILVPIPFIGSKVFEVWKNRETFLQIMENSDAFLDENWKKIQKMVRSRAKTSRDSRSFTFVCSYL